MNYTPLSPAPQPKRKHRLRNTLLIIGGVFVGISVLSALADPEGVKGGVEEGYESGRGTEHEAAGIGRSGPDFVDSTVEDPEAPVEASTTDAPVVTTTEAPAPTTTQAPVVVISTEAPVVAPVVTEAPVETFVVVNVVDGDTLDLDNGERVRLVGIDTPERGECGYDEATMVLASMVFNQTVTLEPSDEDRDKYGRLLRYVVVNDVDAGGQMLAKGYAITRYNSTDGYGLHPREAEYEALVQPSVVTCAPVTTPAPAPVVTPAPAPAPTPPPAPPTNVSYANCDAVRAAGAAPIYVGDPGWQSKFDRDGDGVGCE